MLDRPKRQARTTAKRKRREDRMRRQAEKERWAMLVCFESLRQAHGA